MKDRETRDTKRCVVQRRKKSRGVNVGLESACDDSDGGEGGELNVSGSQRGREVGA